MRACVSRGAAAAAAVDFMRTFKGNAKILIKHYRVIKELQWTFVRSVVTPSNGNRGDLI